MTRDELSRHIADVHLHQCELDRIEVKSANRGTPQRLYEPLSAFANSTGGGIILFGINEEENFEIVGVADVHRLQEEISHLCAAGLEPPLRPSFTVQDVQGKTVLAVEVMPLAARQKPCYYKPAGLQKGAYIRVGNTNRQMTDYEIFGYVSARSQPVFDEEPVADATIGDLDRKSLESFIAALRKARPGIKYLSQPLEKILAQLRVIREVAGVYRPTLAGLLAFGNYPQTYEPQLVITFLHYFGTTETEKTPRGERFLDNRKFEGSIPEMIEAAVNHVMASIRKGSLIDGLYRRDIPEYPEEAIREAVVNAVAHRDYSNYVRGSYVQIRLFADRLEIQSPGGLYGNVTEETLEEEQSTRNRTLVRLMEDLHLVENRGSGIKAMIDAMRTANLEPPRFQDKRSSFWVFLKNLTLMNKSAIDWLNHLADVPLNDRQRLALVFLRHNKELRSFDYQRLNHVDSVTANKDLRGLVQAGLIDQHSTRRWAHYTLNVPTDFEKKVQKTLDEQVLDYVREHGFIKRADCMKLLNISALQAKKLLGRMREMKLLQQVGIRRAAKYILPQQEKSITVHNSP